MSTNITLVLLLWRILTKICICFRKHLNIFLKIFIYFTFRERGKEKEERNINVWLPLLHPLLGTWPATQACALTGNRTGDPLVHRLVHNPLSHTSEEKTFKYY